MTKCEVQCIVRAVCDMEEQVGGLSETESEMMHERTAAIYSHHSAGYHCSRTNGSDRLSSASPFRLSCRILLSLVAAVLPSASNCFVSAASLKQR